MGGPLRHRAGGRGACVIDHARTGSEKGRARAANAPHAEHEAKVEAGLRAPVRVVNAAVLGAQRYAVRVPVRSSGTLRAARTVPGVPLRCAGRRRRRARPLRLLAVHALPRPHGRVPRRGHHVLDALEGERHLLLLTLSLLLTLLLTLLLLLSSRLVALGRSASAVHVTVAPLAVRRASGLALALVALCDVPMSRAEPPGGPPVAPAGGVHWRGHVSKSGPIPKQAARQGAKQPLGVGPVGPSVPVRAIERGGGQVVPLGRRCMAVGHGDVSEFIHKLGPRRPYVSGHGKEAMKAQEVRKRHLRATR